MNAKRKELSDLMPTDGKLNSKDFACKLSHHMLLINDDIQQLANPTKTKLGDWTFAKPSKEQIFESMRNKLNNMVYIINEQEAK